MRIAIVTDQYLPILGGVPDSVVTQVKGLRSLGHTVEVFAPDLPRSEPEEGVIRIRAQRIAGGAGALVLPFGLKKMLRTFKPDVLHVHSVGIAAFAGIQAGRSLKIPVVATCHGSMADYLHLVGLDFAFLKRLVRSLEGWYFNRVILVTAPSQQPLDALMQNGLRRPMMTVISNAIDFGLFRATDHKVELKHKLGLSAHTVMLFGRIAAEKNLEFALEIIAEAAKKIDLDIVVLGDGPERKNFEAKAAALGLANRIHMMGTLRGEPLVEAINACNVMLTTSQMEAQPMTILQAARCGLPVIGARAGGVPECIQDGVTGFVVDPTDKTTLASRLVELLENDSLRQTMGEAAQKFVGNYAPEHVAELFVDVYQKAIDLNVIDGL